jgi:hypothetical protein
LERTTLDIVDNLRYLVLLIVLSKEEFQFLIELDSLFLLLLIIQGERDYQVQSKIEIPLWKEQLKERDNVDY